MKKINIKNLLNLKNQFLILSTVLIFTVIIGLVTSFASPDEKSVAFSFNTILNANPDTERIADKETVNGYKEVFKQQADYDGRIWTDKSVYSFSETKGKVTLDNNISYLNSGNGFITNFQADFLNVFSVLGSNQTTTRDIIPIDIEFVIDVTNSMLGTELKTVLSATNKIIKNFKAASPNSRIGITFYWGTAHQIVPLTDYYPQISTDYEVKTDANGMKEALITYTLKDYNTGEVVSKVKYNPITGKNTLLSGKFPDGIEENSNPLGGGTSNQAGIIAGLKDLVDNPVKTYKTADGNELTKTPTLILLGDGNANHILADTGDSDVLGEINYEHRPEAVTTSGNWWDVREPNISVASGGGSDVTIMKSLLSAAYWKSAVANAYNVPLSGVKIYTIGFADGSKNPILNPQTGIIETTNETRKKLYESFLDWQKGNTQVLQIEAEKTTGYDGNNSKGPYSLSRPKTTYNFNQIPKEDKYKVTMDSLDLNYVSKFYTATTNNINKVYTTIYNDLLSYTYVDNPLKANTTLKYSDPIGENLEVKNVDSLLLFGQKYNIKERTATTSEKNSQKSGVQYTYYEVENGNTSIPNHGYDEYVSDGRINTTVTFKLNEIKIWTETTNTSSQTLYIEIPNRVLPIINARYLTADDDTTTFISNENTPQSLPLRILYTVGLKDSLFNENARIKLDALTKNYLSEYLVRKNNKEYIEFYSNYYNDATSNGEATVEYTISDINGHYLYQNYLTLYKTSKNGDSNNEGILKATGGNVVLSDKVTNLDQIDKNATYYYIKSYYEKTGKDDEAKLIQYAVAAKGSEFYDNNGNSHLVYYNEEDEEVVESTGKNVVVATNIGTTINKNLNSKTNKEDNITKTATTSLASNYNNKKVTDYLGNNGQLEVLNSRDLELRKEVQGTSGDKNAEWTFDIKLTPKNGINLNTTYNYKGGSFIDDVASLKDGQLTLTKNSSGSYTGKVKLKHGQSITILGIEEGTTYEITEENANTDNYKLTAKNNKGTLNSNTLIEMQNTKGFDLPKTGQSGTIFQYIVGIIFIVWGVVTFMLIKEQRKKENN